MEWRGENNKLLYCIDILLGVFTEDSKTFGVIWELQMYKLEIAGKWLPLGALQPSDVVSAHPRACLDLVGNYN